MKKSLLILVWSIACIVLFASQGWGVCPEDTVDSGICDTLFLEVWSADANFPLPTGYAKISLYVSHDQPGDVDSIAAFALPLCYTHSNPSKFCSLTAYQNQILWGAGARLRSVFRHLPDNTTATVHNWMMDLFQDGHGEEWDGIILDLDGVSHFWLTLIPSGSPDKRYGETTKRLTATMSFKLQDSMMVCVDTCFWPPSSHLAFSRSDAHNYIPRHNLPLCHDFKICINMGPNITCPYTQAHHTNYHYHTGEFVAYDRSGCAMLSSVRASFQGAGVENVNVVYSNPPPAPMLTGHVEYDVTDCSEPGGNMALVVEDEFGSKDTCFFGINIWNNPPVLSVPDSIFALADHISGFPVSATDADNDPVNIAMNAFWFAQDSLKTPVNPPSYNGNNPGFFSWVPASSDSGRWIASFSATDICGKANTDRTVIWVGMSSCGDCTNDSLIDVGDVVYLINYLFKGGAAPDPVCQGDVNCSGLADIGDVILLINYLYKGGSAPCFGCCG